MAHKKLLKKVQVNYVNFSVQSLVYEFIKKIAMHLTFRIIK